MLETPAGPVPRVHTFTSWRDKLGTVLARLGSIRDNYKIVPGLYAVGHPDSSSPVLVSANYKLSFDAVRKELGGVNAWVLVLDTHGINVWCAAGKGTFATDELAHRIRHSGLDKVVSHRAVIVPQLGATGVSAFKVKRQCGFEVRFGPVYARDLKKYLTQGHVDEAMRRVTFTMAERAVLVPVEWALLGKSFFMALAALVVLSGIGPDVFSLTAAWSRGLVAVSAVLGGLFAGTTLVPLLLPWLPSRVFALKGAVAGLCVGLGPALWLAQGGWMETVSMLLWSVAVASFAGMNFTGSTPYTSPSGVEKEMRMALPLQLAASVAGCTLWVISRFAGAA